MDNENVVDECVVCVCVSTFKDFFLKAKQKQKNVAEAKKSFFFSFIIRFDTFIYNG